ncbi:transposase, partial [Escherichia coli]|uniref:transposase n=1 Tax=Escherichia coli TaxID=562 RepID=UPI003F75F61F
WKGWAILLRQKQKKLIMLPSETMIWQPEFTDKTLSRKPGAVHPGKVRTLKQHPRKNKTAINIEYMKASIRAKVEHPFRIIKRQFGFVKARYKGLLKNDNQLAMLFTLANLFRADQMIRQWERSH